MDNNKVNKAYAHGLITAREARRAKGESDHILKLALASFWLLLLLCLVGILVIATFFGTY